MSGVDHEDQKPSIDVDSDDQKATTNKPDAGRYAINTFSIGTKSCYKSNLCSGSHIRTTDIIK